MISIWLFGTTAGFEIQTIGPVMPVNLVKEWVSLPPEIELNNNGVIGVTRRNVDGKIVTWIGVYRTIFEIGYQRRGGFYGAGIWIVDQLLDANTVIPILIKLSDQLQSLGTNNGQFFKRISEINPKISLSTNEAQVLANSAEPYSNMGISTVANQAAFVATRDAFTNIVDWALKSEQSHIYRGIYCGDGSQLPRASGSVVKLNSLSDVYVSLYQDIKKKYDVLNYQFQQSRADQEATKHEMKLLESKQENDNLKLSSLLQEKIQLENQLEGYKRAFTKNKHDQSDNDKKARFGNEKLLDGSSEVQSDKNKINKQLPKSDYSSDLEAVKNRSRGSKSSSYIYWLLPAVVGVLPLLYVILYNTNYLPFRATVEVEAEKLQHKGSQVTQYTPGKSEQDCAMSAHTNPDNPHQTVHDNYGDNGDPMADRKDGSGETRQAPEPSPNNPSTNPNHPEPHELGRDNRAAKPRLNTNPGAPKADIIRPFDDADSTARVIHFMQFSLERRDIICKFAKNSESSKKNPESSKKNPESSKMTDRYICNSGLGKDFIEPHPLQDDAYLGTICHDGKNDCVALYFYTNQKSSKDNRIDNLKLNLKYRIENENQAKGSAFLYYCGRYQLDENNNCSEN
jgi:hypothetical protein